jgi:hypothetical protein
MRSKSKKTGLEPASKKLRVLSKGTRSSGALGIKDVLSQFGIYFLLAISTLVLIVILEALCESCIDYAFDLIRSRRLPIPQKALNLVYDR